VKILTDNRKKLIERYDNEEKDIYKSINFTLSKENISKADLFELNMAILIHFLVKLIEINEIELVNTAIDSINKYKFPRGFSFNYYLAEKIIYGTDDINIITTLINIIGENNFMKEFELIIKHDLLHKSKINVFLNNLVMLERYDLLIKSLQILIDRDYTGNGKVINKILQGIKKAIRLKNDDLIIRYNNIIGTMSFLNTVKSGNRQTNARKLENFNKLIKEAEESK
jgi:hypothetical protein